MFFALLRFSPAVLALLQALLLKLMITTRVGWYWYLIILLVLDLIYFFVLKVKLKTKGLIGLAIHSWLLTASGFAFLLVISNRIFVNFFIGLWSGILFFYLESIFHYCYESRKQVLFNLSNVISYANLLIFFTALATVFNFHIFLEIGWWWNLLVCLMVSLILLPNYYAVNQVKSEDGWVYIGVIVLLLGEMVFALGYWPVSFYVLTLVATLGYYILSSLSLLYWQQKLTTAKIWQYVGLSLALLGLVLITTIWL